MPRMKFVFRLFSGLALVAILSQSSSLLRAADAAQLETNLVVKADREDARYKLGETVTFTARLVNLPDQNLDYTVKENHFKVLDKGTLVFKNGIATVQAVFKNPGFLFLSIDKPKGLSIKNRYDKMRAGLGGAVCAPEKLLPGLPEPDDFNRFWADKKKVMDQIPFNAKLELIEEQSSEKVEVYSMILDSYKGSKIRGFFARPRRKTDCPAIMFTHGAGVYAISSTNVKRWAEKGAIAIDLNAHDLPNDEPKDFYTRLAKGKLKNYRTFGREDRETCYFLRMFLSCYQTAKYVTSRPEWNGKQFVVYGSSQGGAQTLATAYLCNKVSAFFANVCALCDQAGREVGRESGWPKMGYEKEQANARYLETSRYFDAANFAHFIRAKALMSCGFVDTTCVPSSVYVAYNRLRGEKRMIENPCGVHELQPAVKEEANAFLQKEMELDK